MPKGPAPKPTVLKVLEGNPGQRRLNKKEPIPLHDLLTPPKGLLAAARADWEFFLAEAARGQLKRVDGPALAIMCNSLVFIREITEILNSSSPLLRNKNNEVQRNPALLALKHHQDTYLRYAVELGMTPSARSRIKVEDAAAPENELARMIGV